MTFLVLNGVNLNMLGQREPSVYGSETLNDLENLVKEYCVENDIEVEFYQSNFEGEFIEAIHKSWRYDGVIINPGAWSHYSYAIRDAISAVNVPFVEVHISNIHEREEFRHNTVIEDVVVKSIVGEGFPGYTSAIKFLQGLDK